MEEDIRGLTDIEVTKLIDKKKKRYCAILLNEAEEVLDPETFKRMRKVVLDNMNGFTRSVFTIIGISIEGSEY